MRRVALLVSFVAAVLMSLPISAFCAESINCWFPPEWKDKGSQAKAITETLSRNSGFDIRPRIAKSYPELLTAFSSGDQSLVYVGSFVQAIIKARNLGTPLVQNIDGKDLYSGVMVYPKGENPEELLKNNPSQIAFAVGASSGESSAKAATGGQAAMGVANHGAAVGAVKAGKAKAAVVKNWWWESNREKFPEMELYSLPGISIEKNPDNVLTASKAVPADAVKKITAAAIAGKDAFEAPQMAPFDLSRLDFPLALMKQGKIDPLTYSW
jgi:ABC-type phosphate/phosphonate transport system substrate-binding protein